MCTVAMGAPLRRAGPKLPLTNGVAKCINRAVLCVFVGLCVTSNCRHEVLAERLALLQDGTD